MNNMNRLLEMETFVQIVDTGSISAAADRMDTAKSAVSRRLAELESRVGASLLNRTTRRLSLTGAGAAFYERCKTILAAVAEAERCVGEAEADLSGTLRVAAPVSFGVAHLGPAINDFLMEHPDVEFDLDFNDRQTDLIAEGFDLAIRITKLRDSSLVARRLTSIRSVVCASPGYWNACGRPEQPDELKQHRALRYSNASRRSWSWTGPGGERGSVTVPFSQMSNNGTYLGQAATAGLGVICIPLFIVHEAIQSGQLEPALTRYRWGDVDAYAVYPQTRRVSRRVRTFIDFLAERFGDTPYWDLCLESDGS